MVNSVRRVPLTSGAKVGYITGVHENYGVIVPQLRRIPITMLFEGKAEEAPKISPHGYVWGRYIRTFHQHPVNDHAS